MRGSSVIGGTDFPPNGVFFLVLFFRALSSDFFLSSYWIGWGARTRAFGSRGTYDVIGYRVSARTLIGRSTAHGRRRGVTTDLLRKNVDSFYTTHHRSPSPLPPPTPPPPPWGARESAKKESAKEESDAGRGGHSSFLSALCAVPVRSARNKRFDEEMADVRRLCQVPKGVC